MTDVGGKRSNICSAGPKSDGTVPFPVCTSLITCDLLFLGVCECGFVSYSIFCPLRLSNQAALTSESSAIWQISGQAHSK